MKFKNFIFKAWKSWNLTLLVLESRGKLKLCLVDLLLQMSKQGQCAIEKSNKQHKQLAYLSETSLCLLN